MYRYTKLSLLVVLAFCTAAIAAKRSENDASGIEGSKLSLVQAIALAERNVNGKATRAEFESTVLGRVFEVEVVNGDKVYDVRIDAEQATVISAVEDANDHDDDERDGDE